MLLIAHNVSYTAAPHTTSHIARTPHLLVSEVRAEDAVRAFLAGIRHHVGQLPRHLASASWERARGDWQVG